MREERLRRQEIENRDGMKSLRRQEIENPERRDGAPHRLGV
jgi:hypothetical protein